MVVRRQAKWEKKHTSSCRPWFKNVACLSFLMLMKILKEKKKQNNLDNSKGKTKIKTQHTFQEIIIYYYPFRT